ncbi:hypothetical protein ACFLWX_03945 [Chloroflexota bacterium]
MIPVSAPASVPALEGALRRDGSHHTWLEDNGPRLNLLLAVDNTTRTIPYTIFRHDKDTYGYLTLLEASSSDMAYPSPCTRIVTPSSSRRGLERKMHNTVKTSRPPRWSVRYGSWE